MLINSNPIFILGTQRSGTTLLTRILSSHKNIFIQNEVNILKVFNGKPDKNELLKRFSDEIYNHNGLNSEELHLTINKKIWGIKDPQFTEHIDALKQFLPESKFILIIRDGRGVVNSYMANKWGLGTNVYTGAQRWQREVKQQKSFMMEFPNNFILIRYEDLIADIEQEMKKLCFFLDIDFDTNMLEYHTKKANFKKNKSNINTNNQPNFNFVEKWKKELSMNQINIIERIAGEELKESGYELIGNKITITPWEKIYYTLHQAILGELQIQYQLKKHWLKSNLKMSKR